MHIAHLLHHHDKPAGTSTLQTPLYNYGNQTTLLRNIAETGLWLLQDHVLR